MKNKIFSIVLCAILLVALLVPASAAGTPGVALTRTALSGDKYTVTVNFTDIPAGNGVEYAQILLTCRSSQHNIVNNSMTMLASGDIKVTKQFNTSADSLLVLIEPNNNSFAGIGSTGVFTFTVSQSGGEQIDPGFDLSAILILKDGTEKEINQRVSALLPNAPTTPTNPPVTPTNPPVTPTTYPGTPTNPPVTPTDPPTVPPTTLPPTTRPTEPPTTVPRDPGSEDPCKKGHTFQKGYCIYCLEKDPDFNICGEGHTFENGYCVYCLAVDPEFNHATIPTNPPVSTPNGGQQENSQQAPWMLIAMMFGAVAVAGAVCLVLALSKKKK